MVRRSSEAIFTEAARNITAAKRLVFVFLFVLSFLSVIVYRRNLRRARKESAALGFDPICFLILRVAYVSQCGRWSCGGGMILNVTENRRGKRRGQRR